MTGNKAKCTVAQGEKGQSKALIVSDRGRMKTCKIQETNRERGRLSLRYMYFIQGMQPVLENRT